MKTKLEFHLLLIILAKIQKCDKYFVVKAVETQAFSHITGGVPNGPTPREQNLVIPGEKLHVILSFDPLIPLEDIPSPV